MEQRKVNPWDWQNQFAFSQAIEVAGGSRVLYCAGQTSVDEDDTFEVNSISLLHFKQLATTKLNLSLYFIVFLNGIY